MSKYKEHVCGNKLYVQEYRLEVKQAFMWTDVMMAPVTKRKLYLNISKPVVNATPELPHLISPFITK